MLSDATNVVPWLTMEAIVGYCVSTEVRVRSMNVTPEYRGLAGDRRGRSIDQAPSAPMTRSKVSSFPSSKRSLCWEFSGLTLLTLWPHLIVPSASESRRI